MATRPDAALSHGIDVRFALSPSLGATREEEVVRPFDGALDKEAFVGEHRTREVAQVGEGVRLDHIACNPNLMERAREVWHYPEDPDGAGQRRRLGHNLVGGARDVVAPRSRIVAHRDDDRLDRLQVGDGLPDLFRQIRVAARGVDAEDDGLHLILFRQVAQVADNILRD